MYAFYLRIISYSMHCNLNILMFFQNIVAINRLIYMRIKQLNNLFYGIVSSKSLCIINEFYVHCWNDRRLYQLDLFRFPKGFLKISDKEIERRYQKWKLLTDMHTSISYFLYYQTSDIILIYS